MEDIRDIKGLVPVPHDWTWLWIALAGLAILAIGYWFFKRREKPVAVPPIIPVLSPLEAALAALQQLRQDNPPVEIFYTRLSDIVRQFIEGQFGLRAPERTTEEFLAEATLPADSMSLLSAFLQESDLVKFARLRPGQEDMERAFSAAETFVRRSDIPVATSAADGRGKNAAPTTT